MGLIHLEPSIRGFLKLLIKNEGISMLLSATISAQIFTLPVVVYNFDRISFVSPIVNLMVMPIIYFVMLFGFLSALLGVVIPWLVWIVSVPCYFLMLYFVSTVNFFSRNWAYKTVDNVHWLWLIVSYVLIGGFTHFLNSRFKQKIVNM